MVLMAMMFCPDPRGADAGEHLQTHIPALAWLSSGFGFDRSCLTRIADNPYSQDNLFDSVLGLFAVRTSVYKPDADIFGQCRAANREDGLGALNQ